MAKQSKANNAKQRRTQQSHAKQSRAFSPSISFRIVFCNTTTISMGPPQIHFSTTTSTVWVLVFPNCPGLLLLLPPPLLQTNINANQHQCKSTSVQTNHQSKPALMQTNINANQTQCKPIINASQQQFKPTSM